MTSLAFLGLGIMGGPMAANLVKAGHEVTGYNRSRKKVDQLVEQGGSGADSIADAVRDADVVFTMLPDSPDVEDVAFGDDGIFAHASKGTLYVDASTIRPDVSRQLAETGAERGLRVLDAPVSGGEQGAIEGNLSIMVGGTEEDFAAAEPLLGAVGSTVVHVGPAGAGQTVKAANQLIVAATIEVVAESIVFLEAQGVDLPAAIKVLSGGLAGSRILDAKAAGMLARDFEPGFRVELHHKDLGILTSAARQAGVVVPLGALLAQLMAASQAQGDGDLDHSALLRVVERLSGRAS